MNCQVCFKHEATREWSFLWVCKDCYELLERKQRERMKEERE